MKLHIQNRYKGGVKASRNNPKCYIKQNRKEMQSCIKLSFSRKHLSLESVYNSLGISEYPINFLKIGTSGDVSTIYKTIYCVKIKKIEDEGEVDF